MDAGTPKTGLERRKLLTGLGGLGAAVAFGGRLGSGAASGRAAAQAEATPTAASTWTPPPIPQPLPTPGGTPPPIVGAAPPEPEAPSTGDATGLENPQAVAGAGDGTPGASPVSGEFPVTSPGQPPQAAGTPIVGPETTPTPAVTVTLTADFRFDPPEVTVAVGEAVEWVNRGRSPQTVTCNAMLARDKSRPTVPAGAEPWDSGVLNFGDAFVQVFETAGEYVYFSIPSEEAGMIGRVVVR